MRTFFSALLTLIAMAAIVVAVPSMWVSQRLVDENGFVEVVAPLAHERQMQDFIAEKITDQVVSQVSISGAQALVAPIAQNYTRGDTFPADFTDLVRQQHSWLFSQAPANATDQTMQLNIAPMINRAIASGNLPFTVSVDQRVEVPLSEGGGLEAGRYHRVGQQIRTIGYGASALAVIAGLLALLMARRRGTVLVGLGIGGLLAAGASWALARSAGTIVDHQLSTSQAGGATVTKLAVDAVAADLTHWASITGIAGAVVAVIGIVVAVAVRRPAYR